ncbi:MAG TPA: sigma-54 dependent transcriptional regulator [Candidatus Binataceae bacterium]|nr:sigma-54 dependent transcriptional regulator [Candidatus Binataceae bacterium]
MPGHSMSTVGTRVLVGSSNSMRQVCSALEILAPCNAPAILTGESGTGKEIAARTIHELSPRRSGPYVAINCATLPETLIESELFGHERGAFTGADSRRLGCFEIARGGTILLDEIAEMRIDAQAKLLRVLEDRRVRRLGGTAEIPLDVRVLAATNRDLRQTIREGKFRGDLFYRLNVFTVEIPPLRHRLEDLPALIAHFMTLFARRDRLSPAKVDDECLSALMAYDWPGNVRQLRNVIQRAMVVATPPVITIRDLPSDVLHRAPRDGDIEVRLGASLGEAERELILRTLNAVQGNKVRASEILGVSLKTLYNRLEKYRGHQNSDDRE